MTNTEEKPVLEIGDKVRAKYLTFYNEDFDRLTSAWTPHIEVDGEMLKIHDETNPLGFMTAESRYKALKIAREQRDKIRAKRAAKEPTL